MSSLTPRHLRHPAISSKHHSSHQRSPHPYPHQSPPVPLPKMIMQPAFTPPLPLPNPLHSHPHPYHPHPYHPHPFRTPIKSVATPPRRKSQLPNDLRQALQTSLQSRHSRIALTLPPGIPLGTEPRPDSQPSQDTVPASNRELARLVAAMFGGTGLRLVVVFSNEGEMSRAGKIWGSDVEILHWGRDRGRAKAKTKGKGKANRGSGFGSQASQVEQADAGTPDVFVLVGGGAAFLQRARGLADEYGMDKLVILLNPNSDCDALPVDLDAFCEQQFEHVYYYRPNPHPRWSGGVLFRKFPDDWLLGRITPIGTLQKLSVTPDRPSLDDIAEALGKEQSKPQSGLMRKLSGLMDWNSP